MDILQYIGVIILLIGLIGIFIISLSSPFEDDKSDKPHRKEAPKPHSINPSNNGTPE